jgi:hypothetical protein
VLTAFSEPAIAMSGSHRTTEQVSPALRRFEIGDGTVVSVRLRNNKIVSGQLTAIGDVSFLVTNPETQIVTQVAFNNVKQLSALSNRAKITLTVGVLGAALLLYLICYGAGDAEASRDHTAKHRLSCIRERKGCILQARRKGSDAKSDDCAAVDDFHTESGSPLQANMGRHLGGRMVPVARTQRGDATRILSMRTGNVCCAVPRAFYCACFG